MVLYSNVESAVESDFRVLSMEHRYCIDRALLRSCRLRGVRLFVTQ